jgi:hypothetical protein
MWSINSVLFTYTPSVETVHAAARFRLFLLKDVGGQACGRTNSNGNFTALT